MITYVNKNNAGIYQTRFEQAELALRHKAEATNAELGALYGECISASDDAAKVVTIDDLGSSFAEGTIIYVKFTNGNTTGSPTLKVNDGSAIAVSGTNAEVTWKKNAIISFSYTGGRWKVNSSDITVDSLEKYFFYLKQLAGIDPFYTMLPIDEETFDIDANTRKVAVPADYAKNGIGVQGDEVAEVIYFTIDRFFDSMDLSSRDMNIAIQWETADKVAGVSKEYLRDINSVPGKLVFGWPLTSDITKVPGKVKFSVRFYTIGSRINETTNTTEKYLTYNFNTIPAELTINSSLDYQLFQVREGQDSSEYLDPALAEHLVTTDLVNRLVSTEITDPSIPAASAPEWAKNLSGSLLEDREIAAIHTAVAGGTMTEEEGDIALGVYLIKDLDPHYASTVINGAVVDIPGYEMEVFAKATGAGRIDYTWRHTGLTIGRTATSGTTIMSEATGYAVQDPAYVPAVTGRLQLDGTLAESWPIQEGVTYYVKEMDTNNTVYYTPISLTNDYNLEWDAVAEKVIYDDGITAKEIYEKHSKAVAAVAGIYEVEATNWRSTKHAEITSFKLIFPAPQTPNIAVEEYAEKITYPAQTTDYTNYEAKEFNKIFDEDALDPQYGEKVIHALIDTDGSVILPTTAVSPEVAEAEENGWATPATELTYEWYTKAGEGTAIMAEDSQTHIPYIVNAEANKISGATAAAYEFTVPAGERDGYDEIVYGRVINNRNNAQAGRFTKPYRITPAPKMPKLNAALNTNHWTLEDAGSASSAPHQTISVGVGHITIDVAQDIQTDGITYQWMMFNKEGNTSEAGVLTYLYGDDDVAVTSRAEETTNTQYKNTFTFGPSDVGNTFYCVITNHLNGATNSVRTQMFSIQ